MALRQLFVLVDGSMGRMIAQARSEITRDFRREVSRASAAIAVLIFEPALETPSLGLVGGPVQDVGAFLFASVHREVS